MKYLPFILKHLRQNWTRTTSTVLAIVVGIFLFCTLQTIIAAINWGLRSTNASRLVVRNAVSLMYYLPLSYKEKIRTIPGVTNVSVSNFVQKGASSEVMSDISRENAAAISVDPRVARGADGRFMASREIVVFISPRTRISRLASYVLEVKGGI